MSQEEQEAVPVTDPSDETSNGAWTEATALDRLVSFAMRAGPKLESLEVGFRDLSADYRKLSGDLAKLTGDVAILVATGREQAEQVGTMLGMVSRATARVGAVEQSVAIGAEATDREIERLNRISAANRETINRLTRDRDDISDLGEITKVRAAPVSAALATATATIQAQGAQLTEQSKTQGKLLNVVAAGLVAVLIAVVSSALTRACGVNVSQPATKEAQP